MRAEPFRCVSCKDKESPNLDRSGCEPDNSESDCIARPADSRSLSFDCPAGWPKLLAGNTLDDTPGCVTTQPADSGASCKEVWAKLVDQSVVIGAIPNLAESKSNGKLVCKCAGDKEGYVLKRQLDGSFACLAEAAFLPNEGRDTDSPPLASGVRGIWYDVKPPKSCMGAQQW